MNLHEFIKKWIARNTIVKLWKPINRGKPYGDEILLTEDQGVMEWEVLDVDELKNVPVIHITDILCEKSIEAVNIVVDTDFERNDIIRMFEQREIQREKERMWMEDERK